MKTSTLCFIALFIFTLPFCAFASEEGEPMTFRVNRSDYTFSTIFDMASDAKSHGSILKSSFHITTHYDSYDRFGLFEGQGICRILTLGFFYPWATEIDIYNAHGTKIGMIDGQVVSSEPAKFSIYDAQDNRICVAYLDQNRMGFIFVDPDNPAFVIARLTRNFIADTLDNWDVTLFHPELLPLKFMKIFAAFACDTQDQFKPDL